MARDRKGQAVESVRAALRRLTSEIDGLDAQAAEYFGLNRTDQHCIDVIANRGPMTPSEIAQATSLTSGGTTIALDRLEKAGLVCRRPNPSDRRSVLVEATDKTGQLAQEFFGPLADEERRLLERFEADQLQAISEFLAGLAEAITHRTGLVARAQMMGS